MDHLPDILTEGILIQQLRLLSKSKDPPPTPNENYTANIFMGRLDFDFDFYAEAYGLRQIAT